MSATGSVISVKQAQKLDRRARERLGVPAQILMENAGRQVVEALVRLRRCRRPAIICGKGSNGGDGLVAARHLLVRGIPAQVFLAGTPQELKGPSRLQWIILNRLGLNVSLLNPDTLAGLGGKLRSCDCIIDALFGIGLSGEIRGMYRAVIDAINAARAYVLAVDVPSGLDADTGRICGVCVRADATVTFVAPKPGMRQRRAAKLCGRIIVADIGVPPVKA
jgi:NAD(P)H-hydrate epimerase